MERQPKREELVDNLRSKFAAGGYDAIMPIIDDILQRGMIHEPEQVPCRDCGVELDVPSNGMGSNAHFHPLRCPPCAQTQTKKRVRMRQGQ